MIHPVEQTAIAHVRKDGTCQTVAEHLLEVSNLAGRYASKVSLGSAGALLGLSHDLGKYSEEFQNYLRSAAGLLEQDIDVDYVDPESKKGKIDHSTAGAQELWEEFSSHGELAGVLGQFLALCVASHHSGLIDCVAVDGLDKFSRRMGKADVLAHRREAWLKLDIGVRERWSALIRDDELIPSFRKLVKRICQSARSTTAIEFEMGMLARFLFSCLIDADRVSTADFESPAAAKQRLNGEYAEWPVLVARLESKLAGFKCESKIDELRRDVSGHCFNAADRGKGAFTLTVPTGGGKTLASLRFALHLADRERMERVIYVIPYTSIIDQNADEIRKILEPGGVEPGSIVLEHHSNLMPEKQTWRNKILSENWDAPVVFTTAVQLLEALFAAGTRGARRMHQLANAVLIFDEIQTLPVQCVHMFNNAVNFLVEQCGSSVVLCTATQPLLHEVDAKKGALHLKAEGSELMPDVAPLFAEFQRNEVEYLRKPAGWSASEVAGLALSESKSSGSCLIVVNTKAAAKELYKLCAAASPETLVFHLSTNMCPKHRKACLAEIKKRIRSGEKQPVICVSTQLIEAGIDIDFGSAIRHLAGIDSIAQAAGRCNRHGLRSTGRVLVVNPDKPVPDALKDIRAGQQSAERVLHEVLGTGESRVDLQNPELIRRYFKYYFFERAKEMDYPVKADDVGRNDTLLNMLSENGQAVEASDRTLKIHLRQSFMTAAQAFKAINSPGQGVVVPYGAEGKAVIADLCSALQPDELPRVLWRAQQFTVNVYPSAIKGLTKADAIYEAQEGLGVLCLDPRHYHPEFGLSSRAEGEMEFLYHEF
jgi:CRISPR-associated endonuclease/helicase Cas3